VTRLPRAPESFGVMAAESSHPRRSSGSLLRRVNTLRRAKGGERPAGGATCKYLAVIMDGNGRWAKRKHLPVAAGHRAGAKALRRFIERCLDHGIAEVTCYSFSSENWRRSAEEVEALMDLFVDQVETQVPEVQRRGVEVRFIGRRSGVRDDLLARIAMAESANPAEPKMTMYIAFNYGGRDEIIDAVRGLVADAAGGDVEVSEEALRAHFYSPGMHDPELLIRTSGEERISNFLLWQIAYTELYFSQKLWPDFKPQDLDDALAAYAQRARRFGGR
jgi:undecaprenyl diphosphate synthase